MEYYTYWSNFFFDIFLRCYSRCSASNYNWNCWVTLYLTRSVVEKWGEVRYQFETQRIKSISQPFDNIKILF